MVLSFGENYNNGIPIIPFFNNKKDIELLMLKEYLNYLLLFKNPVKINKKYFNLYKYSQYKDLKQLYSSLFN